MKPNRKFTDKHKALYEKLLKHGVQTNFQEPMKISLTPDERKIAEELSEMEFTVSNDDIPMDAKYGIFDFHCNIYFEDVQELSVGSELYAEIKQKWVEAGHPLPASEFIEQYLKKEASDCH